MYTGFLDALEQFGKSDVFSKALFEGITGGDIHTKDLQSVISETLQQYIPGQIQNQVAGGFYAGASGTGASSAFIDQMFQQANQFNADKRVQFVATVVKAVIDLADAADSLSEKSIAFDVGANSMERLGKGIDDVMAQISTIQARMAVEIDLDAKAKDASRIAALVQQARQAEIQMLQQIDSLQKGISQSIKSQTEGLYLGGLSPAKQQDYLKGQISDYMGLLKSATSQEDVQRYVQLIQQYVSQLSSTYGDKLYQPMYGIGGFGSGETPADYLMGILKDTQAAADEQLQGMRDAIKDKNQALLDALQSTSDQFYDLDSVSASAADSISSLDAAASAAADTLTSVAGASDSASTDATAKDVAKNLNAATARRSNGTATFAEMLAMAAMNKRGGGAPDLSQLLGGGGLLVTLDGDLAPLVARVSASLASRGGAVPLGRV